eukprot:12787494-Alexandrium_andersonii.AAC.1
MQARKHARALARTRAHDHTPTHACTQARAQAWMYARTCGHRSDSLAHAHMQSERMPSCKQWPPSPAEQQQQA